MGSGSANWLHSFVNKKFDSAYKLYYYNIKLFNPLWLSWLERIADNNEVKSSNLFSTEQQTMPTHVGIVFVFLH